MSLKDFQFQTDENYSAGGLRPHRWLGAEKKSHYIPGWYEPHQNLDKEVTHNGEPQGMRVRDVLPFRRWAIGRDGETLAQYDFEQKYMRYMMELTTPETHQPGLEYIPNVKMFVRQKPDHNGQLVDWSYEDSGEIKKEAKYTQDGTLAPEYVQRQNAKAEESGALRALMKLMKSGKLSPDDFAAQAEELYSELAIETKPADEIHAIVSEQKEEERKARIRADKIERMAKARQVRADNLAKQAAAEMGDSVA